MRWHETGVPNNQPATGEYIDDFLSKPGDQVHARVFFKYGILHICYFVKDGLHLGDNRITDRWLGEIFDCLKADGYLCADVFLHGHERDLTEVRPF